MIYQVLLLTNVPVNVPCIQHNVPYLGFSLLNVTVIFIMYTLGTQGLLLIYILLFPDYSYIRKIDKRLFYSEGGEEGSPPTATLIVVEFRNPLLFQLKF